VANSSIFRFFSSKCAATVVPSSGSVLDVGIKSEGCEGSAHPAAGWLALPSSSNVSSSPTPSVFVSSFL
jgi:hypothetical protein